MDIDKLNERLDKLLTKTEGLVISELIFDIPSNLKDKIKPIIELAIMCCHTVPVLTARIKDLEQENKILKRK